VADQIPSRRAAALGPVAPARSTRAISSSQKRSIPREVFAEPLRRERAGLAGLAREATIGG